MEEKEKPVQFSLNKANYGRLDLQRKRESGYSYRVEPSNVLVGPYDLATLHLWVANGLIPETMQVFEGQSTNPVVLADVLREKGLVGKQPEASEWFLWMDQKTPFQSANQRISKVFMGWNVQRKDVKALSIVFQKKEGISINTYQEFEDFAALYFSSERPALPSFGLNEMGEPLACWVHKTMNELGCGCPPEEIRTMVLQEDPEAARQFFLSRLSTENEASKVFAAYHRWRLMIPVHER